MTGMAKVMLSQAEHALRCYANPEPIEVIAARCGVSVEQAKEARDCQTLEAARMGRTEHSLRARVNYWQEQCQR